MRSRVTQKVNDKAGPVQPPVGDIRRIIEAGRRVLVASHIDPDGDAIGTQLAFGELLRSLGKEVFLVREAPVPDKYTFLPGVDAIRPIEEYPADLEIDTAVVLECPVLSRIGGAARFLTGVRILNIDHHYESGDFGDVNWIDPTRSSVGEMTYDLFEALGYEITPTMAEQLFTAILTDTGRFRYQATSPRTLEVAGRLVAAGANPKRITEKIYYNMGASSMKLTARVLSTMEFHDNEAICLLSLTNAMLVESGADMSESDGLIDFTLFTSSVEIGALLKEQDESNTRVSLRSRDGINVSELAARYGGGGHFNASGCTIPLGLEAARRELLTLLTEALHAKRD